MGDAWEKVSLLREYVNSYYRLFAQNAGSATTSYTVKVGSGSKNDADAFYISMSNTSAAAFWYACGYTEV